MFAYLDSNIESFSAQTKRTPAFKKHVVRAGFIAEGATVGDVNKDGKPDILAGAYWFQAPGWKPHEIAKPITFSAKDGYSNTFLNFASDINQDGWIDLVRIDIPGEPAYWYEKDKLCVWKEHLLYKSVGNELPDADISMAMEDPIFYAMIRDEKKMIWLQSPVTAGDTLWK